MGALLTTCCDASKPNRTRAGACSQKSKGLLIEEMAPSPESQVSQHSKTWVPDGSTGMGYVEENSLITVAEGGGVIVSTGWLRPGGG